MTTVYTLASGSSGNALLYLWDGGRFLVDAGISCRRIAAGLRGIGYAPADLDGILITHTHADHISGLNTLLKRTDCPILAGGGVCRELAKRFNTGNRLIPLDRPSVWNGCTVTAFPTSHDAPDSRGFRLDTADGGFGLLTDTGYVTPEARDILPGVSLALLEANYEEELLHGGPYPWYLKERIFGPEGHLSNTDAAAFAVELARAGASELILAHLSRENNTPVLAETAVRRALSAAGYRTRLEIAPRDTAGGAWTIGNA